MHSLCRKENRKHHSSTVENRRLGKGAFTERLQACLEGWVVILPFSVGGTHYGERIGPWRYAGPL
jgi:hypothetical protein